jgi:hypothetical protein
MCLPAGEAMKLSEVMLKFDRWMKRIGQRSEDVFRIPPATARIEKNFLQSAIVRRPKGRRHPTAKVLEWRRRVLLRKGARMHAAMLDRRDSGSLAMLDALGVVVCWYDGSSPNPAVERSNGVLDRHVSQFYMPEDIATSAPLLHLRSAAVEGSSTERGWRKRSDGTVFWGKTLIHPLHLRDGSLQGFSYVVHETQDPWVTENASTIRHLQQRQSEARWQPRESAFGFMLKGVRDEE